MFVRNLGFSGLVKVLREVNEHAGREARKQPLSEYLDLMNLVDGCEASGERNPMHGIRHATENVLFMSCSYEFPRGTNNQ